MSDGRRWYDDDKKYQEEHAFCISKIESLQKALDESENEIIKLKKRNSNLRKKLKKKEYE